MKRTLLLTAIITSIGLVSGIAYADEPLLLSPLNTSVLSTSPSTAGLGDIPTDNGVQVQVNGLEGIYEATYTPNVVVDENMVPQNAAAKGEPVPVKKFPRIRIQTKQRSQGNSYWNAGGKGTKSFF